MVNKLYFTALLLGHGTAAPVVSNGVMQARDDDVARAASLHEGYSALVEPRLVCPPPLQKTRYPLGTDTIPER